MRDPDRIDSASPAVGGPVEHQKHWGTTLATQQREAIERFVPAGGRVLDLGTGRGVAANWLRQNGFSAVGLDRADYAEWGELAPLPFCRAEAGRLPFRDDAFDCTVAFEVLEHCADYRAVLREILRCTRGHLILSVPDCDLDNALRPYNLVAAHWTDPTHCNFFVRETIRAAVEDAGFRVAEVGGCIKIKPNSYFWATLRAPSWIRSAGRFLCQRLRLVQTYWSSILLVAEAPDDKTAR